MSCYFFGDFVENARDFECLLENAEELEIYWKMLKILRKMLRFYQFFLKMLSFFSLCGENASILRVQLFSS